MGGIYDYTDVTHYHATYVSPDWTNLQEVMTIDDHIFYKPKSGKMIEDYKISINVKVTHDEM